MGWAEVGAEVGESVGEVVGASDIVGLNVGGDVGAFVMVGDGLGELTFAAEAIVGRAAVEVVVGCGEVGAEDVGEEDVKTDGRVSRRRMRENHIVSVRRRIASAKFPFIAFFRS